MSSITSVISQAARRSCNLSKRTMVRAYFATPTATFSKIDVKQKQEEMQHQSPDTTVHIPQEVAESEASFSPIINHVFDD
ncbi:hypothetical protein G6F57_006092 [Rhizopus arrhizus]|jgi:hypothetical protein|uniref:Uncharacterized protein n=1 Tax=Rhizopus oryzae TaxID=64495 RepID=A0A9P6XA12_RHIOR|nr:hypothetical protein G6F23_008638 [Rhizopus arrhizus]KAG1412617.1 hypothetical protein G6F58_007925 [Rhizopus delemar]KAG0763771.1 hypothetical protein G6F24_005757 [Rhizopus arrhizus]KAG0784443.1 hypothetical protein G6F22_008313 [Rhizopus arrhizus]KAG0790320.1 hypothetical protein G6F21_005894 [Rhizopus arrhizus]